MSQAVEQNAQRTTDQKRALAARLLRERDAARAAQAAVHRLLEAQAASTPDATAVSFGDQSLTYHELNLRANRLAHRLRRLGVGRETLVGLCIHRSIDMIVGLLGILKAGGAYVPLDPAFPEARLAFMLEDANLKVLVTEQSLRETLPQDSAQILCLDSDWAGIQQESADNLPGGATTGDLAYMLYTSGSTGRPKGVMISHAALLNFLRSLKQILGFTAQDALLAVTTLSFDIAGLELYLPLISGGRVDLFSREDAADGSALAHRLGRGDVTFLQATPATWRLLLEAGWQGAPNLTLLCGGEALPRALADRLLDKGKALWNLYGPTETTIWSSVARVEPGEGPVPIGRPIAETQLYVLDTRLRPVPIGVTGELYIGGAGLARGYGNRSSLTADRFLPDPVGKAPGARLYRTGDLARWRSDGQLECLGRIDHQVKIRGFRVELGEIEAALLLHPAVREAAVTARPDPSGEQALVAYVVARPEGDSSANELRRHLFESLPEYMIPTFFVPLESLPLTPNGKIDRAALPDPVPVRGGQAVYVPPRGPVEEAVASLWSELLGVDRIGAHDHFFELGGHSLFATQVLARVRDLFSVETSLRDFLETPTTAGLARLIERELRAGSGVSAPPITPVPRDEPLIASFAQQRLWFLDQLEPGNAAYNVPAAVRITGQLDVAALESAFNEVARRQESLRTTFEAVGGVPYQIIAPDVRLPLVFEDLTGVPTADREAAALDRLRAEASRPFDLARGPLARAHLLKLGDREHIALVTMHHIISDLWSIGVLIREVAAIHDSQRSGQTADVPELNVQYADFSAWQRDWLQGEPLETQLAYWKTHLAGVQPLELPTDRPRPAAPRHRGDERTRVIPKNVVTELQAIGKKEGATLFMSLLAAFQTLLHRYTQQADFAVGCPIAGRNRTEVENLIGLFVNSLVLRADFSAEPSFRTLLKQTRQAALGAYAHQDLPFEQIVGALLPGRDTARSALFQVMFAHQNAPLPPLESPELSMSVIKANTGTAKFDLILFAEETTDGLLATMEYDTDLFDAATIDRMLRHFETLLEGIVADPDRPVATVPMLTEAESRQLLGGWGDSSAETDPAGRLPEDLDGLSEEELDALLDQFESGNDA
jgi:amino acid adenylation domain-containing protein